MQAFPLRRIRAAALVYLVLLSTALLAMTAHSQGISSPQNPAVASIDSVIVELTRSLAELDKRTQELAANDGTVQRLDAVIKKLEQRLAAVESAQRNQQAQQNTAAIQTIRAPLTVVDDNGEPLLTVKRGSSGSALVTVGNPDGAQIQMAVLTTGDTSILLTDPALKVRIRAQTSGKNALVSTNGEGGYTFLGNDDGIPLIKILNNSEIPVVELRGMLSGAGGITVSSAAGDIVVQAGVTKKGAGVVKTGPNGNGVGAVLGMNGLPASEIQGTTK
jgi:hypothetical protein